MNIRTTWAGYFIWAIYVALMLGVYWGISDTVGNVILGRMVGTDPVIQLLMLTATVLFVCVLFFASRVIVQHLGTGLSQKSDKIALAYWILYAIGVLSALAYRCYYFYNFQTLMRSGSNFYQMAKIEQGQGQQLFENGLDYLYTRFLSVIFLFLGNDIRFAYGFQVVLMVLGIALLTIALERTVGKTEAIVALFLMAFHDDFMVAQAILSPDALYFFLFAAVMLMVSLFIRYVDRNSSGKALGVILGMVSGAMIGALAYVDVSGFLILLFLIFIYGIYDNWSYARVECRQASFGTLFFLTLGMSFVTFSGIMLLDAYMSRIPVVLLAVNYLQGFGQSQGAVFPQEIYYSLLPISFVEIFAILGFIGQKKQKFTPVAAMLILFSYLLTRRGVYAYQLMVLILHLVIAVMGIKMVYVAEKTRRVYAVYGDSLMVQEVDENPAPDAASMPTMNMPKQEKKEKPRFIENPLPLPKKHERKEIDFQYEIQEKDMKFDFEVSQKDEFDKI